MKQSSWIIVAAGVVMTAACIVLYVLQPPFIQNVSAKAYDAMLARACKDPVAGVVAVVDLDDASLNRFGQWPWARYRVAELTRKIFEAGASVVAFDVVFAEADRTSPAMVKKDVEAFFSLRNVAIEGIPPDKQDYDHIFAEVLKKGKVVLGCQMHFSTVPLKEEDVSANFDPNYRGFTQVMGDADRFLVQASTVTLPIPELRQSAKIGFFNAFPDADGIVRRNPLVWALASRKYHALALEAVRLYIDSEGCLAVGTPAGIEDFRIKGIPGSVPTDYNARVLVNYRRTQQKDTESGFSSTFPVYSAMSVLDGKVPAGALTNKIVFIGASAIGLKDVKASPLTQFFSGVEVHATIVDNILAGDMLVCPGWTLGVDVFVIGLTGIFLTLLIARGRSWLSFLITVVTILMCYVVSLWLMDKKNIVFVPAWTILSIVTMYPVLTMIKFWQEEIQKRQVRNMFGTMVSHKVLHFMETHPGSFSLSGRKTEATMFFSDVAGFTTISESLDPMKLSQLLNRYLSPMTRIIMDRNGYVDKFEGDAIMAVWGVPFAMQDHAVQACLAAVEQQEELDRIRPALKEEFGYEIRVRMGLNSGVVTAGNMGSDMRFQYTVMGDAVNQAARLEPVNKDYGTRIIIGEKTRLAAGDAVEVRMLDRLVVKGKTEPITIYELLARKGGLSQERSKVVALYEEALRLHWDRKWDEAVERLDGALALDPDDRPSANMRERIEVYKVNAPPEGWAGETIRATKD